MTRFVSALLFALTLGGCPGPSASPDAASPRDAASIDAPAPGDDAFVAPGEDAPSPVDAASVSDAPSADAPRATDGGGDASRSDAPGAFAVELAEPYGYGNCFMGPPDPLTIFWQLRGRGAPGDTVTVASATLRVTVAASGYDETQTLTLDEPSFAIPPSGTFDVMQRKVSGTPSVPICSFCGETAIGELTLQVTTSSGGAQTLVASGLDLGCVF